MEWSILRFLLFGLMVSVVLATRHRPVERRPTEDVARSKLNDSSSEEEDEFSREFPVCHYSAKNASECIQRAAEYARVFLAHGVPSLNIQPLEPLRVPSVRLRQHSAPDKGFKYDAWLSDVMLKGLTDYSFNKLDVYPDELRVSGNVSLPHLYMTAEFVILGHFQMLPVEATGKLLANFTMCTAHVEAQGARVHRRMVVRDSGVRLSCMGPLAADLQDSYTGNDDMAKITDHIVGMHSSEIVSEVRPAVETALAMVLEDVANKFLKHVPYEMVFPN